MVRAVTFGDFLKGLREERNLTLRQVETETGISNSYLSQIERGDKTGNIPNFSILFRLADLYGVKITDFAEAIEQERQGKIIDLRTLSAKQTYLLKTYNLFSDLRKKSLTDYLNFLMEQQKGQ